MKQCLIVGASGYAGAQLVPLIERHPYLTLSGLAVSDNSPYLSQPFGQHFPQYLDPKRPLIFESLVSLQSQNNWSAIDTVFLATPHELSAELAPKLVAEGKQVFDLSGAFRIKDLAVFEQFYGFCHPYPEYVQQAIYGLAELTGADLPGASLVAVAGCYPSASILSLLPLVKDDLISGTPIINAVSGVSGAGKKADLKTSFCEVSLQAYGVGMHRHLPEIEQALNHEVVFTPHLASYQRGILATVTVPLRKGIDIEQVNHAFENCYKERSLIKYGDQIPAVHFVQNTPFLQTSYRLVNHGKQLQIFTAIDNLLKGAASGAVQCANLVNGWHEGLGLLNRGVQQ